MSMNCLAAQVFLFFAAGFETSSTTMTFCLYELAINSDIQEILRNEVDTVLEKHEGNISYEAIQEMTYLDKVVAGMTLLILYFLT
jgi:cytochrome P450 family 6